VGGPPLEPRRRDSPGGSGESRSRPVHGTPRPGASSGKGRVHRPVACGEPPGPPHATRCSKPNGLSAPTLAIGHRERAPPADFSDLPQVCELICHELDPSLLHRNDKAVTDRLTPHCHRDVVACSVFQRYVKSRVFIDT
jgi:hypothetical protein